VGKIWRDSKYLILLLAVMVVITGAFGWNILTTRRQFTEKQLTSRENWTYHFAVDLGEVNTWFSEEFLKGAREEADALGIVLEIKDVNSSYKDSEGGFIDWACSAHLDAVISAGEAMEYHPYIETALASTATDCVIVKNEMSYGKCSYVGTDNYEEGYVLARKLCEKYGESGADIAVISLEKEKEISASRLDGFYDGLRESGHISIVEERWMEESILEAMGQVESILLERRDIQEVVCFDEVLLTGAARGIIDLNCVRTVDLSGVGYSQEIGEYIRKGIVDVAICPDAGSMGKEAVRLLYERKSGLDGGKSCRRILVDYTALEYGGGRE